MLIQRPETQARGQYDSFLCLKAFTWTAHGLHDLPKIRLVLWLLCFEKRTGVRGRFSWIDFLPTGKRVIKAGMLPWSECLGATWRRGPCLPMERGSQTSCASPSPPTRHAPIPQGPPCCYLLALHLDAHIWPRCPNHSKTESSISLFVLARNPHDFSVILKTS